MTLITTEIALELIRAGIKYGPEVAIAFAKLFQTGATLDDAIGALELAKIKTAEQYIAEAKAAAAAAVLVAASAQPVP